jgi:hypothetical protein
LRLAGNRSEPSKLYRYFGTVAIFALRSGSRQQNDKEDKSADVDEIVYEYSEE